MHIRNYSKFNANIQLLIKTIKYLLLVFFFMTNNVLAQETENHEDTGLFDSEDIQIDKNEEEEEEKEKEKEKDNSVKNDIIKKDISYNKFKKSVSKAPKKSTPKYLKKSTDSGTPAVAVLEFKNFTMDVLFDSLSTSAPHHLTGVLSKSNLVLVERSSISKALKEVELSTTGVIESKTARKLGSMIGASHLILGGISSEGEGIRIHARVVQVETGKAIGLSAFAQSMVEFREAIEELGSKIVFKLCGTVLFPEKVKKRSPFLTGLMSVLPGGGQFYIKEYQKGSIISGLGFLSIGAAVFSHFSYNNSFDEYKKLESGKKQRDNKFNEANLFYNMRNVSLGILASTIVYSVYDAVSDTHKKNKKADDYLANSDTSNLNSVSIKIPAVTNNKIVITAAFDF